MKISAKGERERECVCEGVSVGDQKTDTSLPSDQTKSSQSTLTPVTRTRYCLVPDSGQPVCFLLCLPLRLPSDPCVALSAVCSVSRTIPMVITMTDTSPKLCLSHPLFEKGHFVMSTNIIG